MAKLIFLEWRERETRMGSFSQRELVIEYQLGNPGRTVYVSIVLRDKDDIEALYREIAANIETEDKFS